MPVRCCFFELEAELLQGLKPGDKIRFTIDTERQAIVAINRLER